MISISVNTDIVADGMIYVRALRTRKDVKPIFISIGNFISLDSACALAMRLTYKESHIPLPTQYAEEMKPEAFICPFMRRKAKA